MVKKLVATRRNARLTNCAHRTLRRDAVLRGYVRGKERAGLGGCHVEALGGLAMPSERLDDDIVRDPEKWLLREQAQAMLDLFAEDCGRTPVTLEEVREWASGQDEQHLRSRVNRRLNVVLDAYENPPGSGAVPSAP